MEVLPESGFISCQRKCLIHTTVCLNIQPRKLSQVLHQLFSTVIIILPAYGMSRVYTDVSDPDKKG